MPARELEPGIVTDLRNRLTCGGHLRLDHRFFPELIDVRTVIGA